MISSPKRLILMDRKGRRVVSGLKMFLDKFGRGFPGELKHGFEVDSGTSFCSLGVLPESRQFWVISTGMAAWLWSGLSDLVLMILSFTGSCLEALLVSEVD